MYDYDTTSKNQLKKVVDLSNSQYGFKDDVTNADDLDDDPQDDYNYDMYEGGAFRKQPVAVFSERANLSRGKQRPE